MAALMDGKVKKSGSNRQTTQPPPYFGVPYTIIDIHSDEPVKRAETDCFRVKSSVANEIESAIRTAQETQVPMKVYTGLPCAMWTDPDRVDGEFWVLSTSSVGFSGTCKNHEKDRVLRWKKSGVPNDFACSIPDTQCLAQIGVGYAVTNNEKLFTCRVVGLYVQSSGLQPKYPLWFVQVRRSTTVSRRGNKLVANTKPVALLTLPLNPPLPSISPITAEFTLNKRNMRLIAENADGVQFGVSMYSSSNPDFFQAGTITEESSTPRTTSRHSHRVTGSDEDIVGSESCDTPILSRKSSRRSNSTPSSATRNPRRIASPRPLSSGSLELDVHNQLHPNVRQLPSLEINIPCSQSASTTPVVQQTIEGEYNSGNYTPGRSAILFGTSRKTRRQEPMETTARIGSPVTVPRVQRVMDWDDESTDDWASNILRKASKVSENIVGTPRSRYRIITSPTSPSSLNPLQQTTPYPDSESRDTPTSMEGTYYSKSRSVSSSRMIYTSVRRRNSKVRNEGRVTAVDNVPAAVNNPPVLITPYSRKNPQTLAKSMSANIPRMDQSLFEDHHSEMTGGPQLPSSTHKTVFPQSPSASFTAPSETAVKSPAPGFDHSIPRARNDSNFILSDMLYESDDDDRTRDTLWSPVRILNSRDPTPSVPCEDMSVGNLANQLANTGVKSVTPGTPYEVKQPISFPISEFDKAKLNNVAPNTVDARSIPFAPVGQRNLSPPRSFGIGFSRTDLPGIHESPITKSKRVGEKSAFSVASKTIFTPIILTGASVNDQTNIHELSNRQSTLSIPPAGVLVSPALNGTAATVPVPPLSHEKKPMSVELDDRPFPALNLNDNTLKDKLLNFPSVISHISKPLVLDIASDAAKSTTAWQMLQNPSFISSSLQSTPSRYKPTHAADDLARESNEKQEVTSLDMASYSLLSNSLYDEFNDSDYDLSSITGAGSDGRSSSQPLVLEMDISHAKPSPLSSDLEGIIGLPEIMNTMSYSRIEKGELATLNPSSALQSRGTVNAEPSLFPYSALPSTSFDVKCSSPSTRTQESMGSPIPRVPSRLFLPASGPGTLSPRLSGLDRSTRSFISLDDMSENDEELEDAMRCTPSRLRNEPVTINLPATRDVRHILGDGYD